MVSCQRFSLHFSSLIRLQYYPWLLTFNFGFSCNAVLSVTNSQTVLLTIKHLATMGSVDDIDTTILHIPRIFSETISQKLRYEALSHEPRKRRPNAMQVPPPRRLSWPCVSNLHSMYKAESWQRAATLDNSTPQWRMCKIRVWSYNPLLRSRHHRHVKLAVKT